MKAHVNSGEDEGGGFFRCSSAVSVFVFCVMLTGCALPGVNRSRKAEPGVEIIGSVADPSSLPGESAAGMHAIAAQPATGSAVIRPGLTLRVGVWVAGQKEIDETAMRVSDEGVIKLPLLGAVPVGGMRISGLADELTRRYEEFFVNPQLTVEFVMDQSGATAPWGAVTVLGRVKNPGRIPLPPTRDLAVSSAIQAAGGFDTSADLSDIRITRMTDDGEVDVERVNLNAVGARGQLSQDRRLQDGDVVYVTERIF